MVVEEVNRAEIMPLEMGQKSGGSIPARLSFAGAGFLQERRLPGIKTYFTHGLDSRPHSRRVFAFHRPGILTSVIYTISAGRTGR
jgi:hypothetical protein